MSIDTKEEILRAARQMAQAHGYGGLNFRGLADTVGIKAASIYHHFGSKAELGAAVARRYSQDTSRDLDELRRTAAGPAAALSRYPQIFRRSLESENRLCLGSFMSAEYDDLPRSVTVEVQAFADMNIAWVTNVLSELEPTASQSAEARARAIFAAVAGAQLLARSRADIDVFDDLIETYRATGLLPG